MAGVMTGRFARCLKEAARAEVAERAGQRDLSSASARRLPPGEVPLPRPVPTRGVASGSRRGHPRVAPRVSQRQHQSIGGPAAGEGRTE